MKIYYYGELIEDNGQKIEKNKNQTTQQLQLDFSEAAHNKQAEILQTTNAQSIEALLSSIDLHQDTFYGSLLKGATHA